MLRYHWWICGDSDWLCEPKCDFFAKWESSGHMVLTRHRLWWDDHFLCQITTAVSFLSTFSVKLTNRIRCMHKLIKIHKCLRDNCSVEEVLSGFALLPELFGDCLGRNSSQVRKFHLCIFSLLVQSFWNDHLSPFQQWRTLTLKGCHLLNSCPTSQTLFGKHWVNSSEILLKTVHSEKKTVGTFRWMLELTFLPNGESPRQDVYCLWLVGRRLSLFRGLNPSLLPHGSKRLSLSTAPLSLFPSLVCLNDEKCSSSFFSSSSFSPGQSPPPLPLFSLKMNTFLFKATAGFLHPSSPTVQRRSTSTHNASYSDTLLTFQAPCPLATGSSSPLFLPRLALVALVKDMCGIALI